jgi:prevent-host-death family protein
VGRQADSSERHQHFQSRTKNSRSAVLDHVTESPFASVAGKTFSVRCGLRWDIRQPRTEAELRQIPVSDVTLSRLSVICQSALSWLILSHNLSYMAKSSSVSVRELQQNLKRVMTRVERGETVEVTRRNWPVARLSPGRSLLAGPQRANAKRVRQSPGQPQRFSGGQRRTRRPVIVVLGRRNDDDRHRLERAGRGLRARAFLACSPRGRSHRGPGPVHRSSSS